MARIAPGDVFRIRDDDGGWYHCVACLGLDFLFKADYSAVDLPLEKIADLQNLVRLPVSLPTISRAGWEKIGRLPVDGEIGSYAKYVNEPVGSGKTYIYDNRDASLREATQEELLGLQILAVWDASAQILPMLRACVRGIPSKHTQLLRYPLMPNG